MAAGFVAGLPPSFSRDALAHAHETTDELAACVWRASSLEELEKPVHSLMLNHELSIMRDREETGTRLYGPGYVYPHSDYSEEEL